MIFGAAAVVFGLSTNFVLSPAALSVLGAADLVSVVIRASLVQILTPHAMRGRVSAAHLRGVRSGDDLYTLPIRPCDSRLPLAPETADQCRHPSRVDLGSLLPDRRGP